MSIKKVKITHSIKGFDHKPKNKEYACKYVEEELSIYEIGQLIKQNYILIPNLINIENGRKKYNIRSFSYIPIDLDDIEIKWCDFYKLLNKLKYQPTFVYCTSSWDDKNNKNRFRLIYIMENEINYEQYQKIYQVIENGLKELVPIITDKCMERLNQPCNGTIHSSTVIQKGGLQPLNLYLNVNIEKLIIQNINKQINNYQEKTVNSKKTSHFTQEERLLLQNKNIYQYVTDNRTQYIPIENNLASFDCSIIKRIDYIEIPYFHSKKIKDGKRRKSFLYYQGLKMRLIKPNIDKYELLWNICNVANEDVVIHSAVYNAEDKLMMFQMIQLVDDVLNTDIEAYDKQRRKEDAEYNSKVYKSDFKVNSFYCKMHNLDWRDERSKYIKMLKNMDEDNKTKKEKTSDKIARMYLPTLSNRENAQRIGVSEITIRRWLKTNNN